MRLALLSALLLIGGCHAHESTYYWGEYQSLLYKMHEAPGEAAPVRQVELLSKDVQVAAGKGKPVPPGVLVHRGYMNLLLGRPDLAMVDFQAEKTRYPESAVFIDRLITGMTRKGSASP
jgi:hypothetical protein